MNTVRIVVIVPVMSATPRKARAAFAQALRDAIFRASTQGRIEAMVAEEFWRVVPDPERA